MVNVVKFSQLDVGTTPVATDIFAMSQNMTLSPISTQISSAQYAAYLNTLFLPLTGGTLTGPLFIPDVVFEPGSPEPMQVIPYQGVQTEASSTGGAKQFVLYTTAAPLDATYDNGSNGQGATLTSNTNDVLIVDGLIISALGTRILVRLQPTGHPNGVYSLTQAGITGVQPYILTRTTDYDNSPTGQVLNGSIIYSFGGSSNINSLFVAAILENKPLIVVGTDPLFYFKIQDNTPPAPPIVSGFATLVGGSVNVPYPDLAANDGVQVTTQEVIGTQGILSVPYKYPNTGFVVSSSTLADNSIVFWTVLEGETNPVVPGLVTLVGGNASVTTSVDASSIIMLSIQTPIFSNGKIVVNSITIPTGFSITSGYGLDSSVISWADYEPSSPQQNGLVTLVAGSASVFLPSLGAGDIVLITVQSASGTLGDLSVTNKIPGTGFSIISNSALDTSVVGWVVYPADLSSPNQGLITLLDGVAIVATPNVQADSVILLTSQNPSLTFGNYAVSSPIIPDSSFTIVSNSLIDTSQIGWVIVT